MLRWCSPQSSVPRQTVGHHARAAMYEMGPTAACEGRRGEVPRQCLDIPPAGASACSLLIYPPAGAQWGARPGGLSGGFPNPAKLILVRFAKNGLASMQASNLAPRNPRRVRDASSAAPGPRNQPVYRPCGMPILLFPGPRRRPARSLLIYPPAGAQWSPRPGGLGGGFPNPAKLIWVRFAKNGPASMQASNLAPRTPRRVRDARGRSTLDRPPNPSTLDRPPKPVYPGPPTKSRLPWTAHQKPSTLDRPPAADPPARPPRTVYPVQPTLGRLPCTAHHGRPPNPSRVTLLYSTSNDVIYI